MSRTDKDRPFWVRSYQDGGQIEHDHRSGVCIEEDLEYAQWSNGNWRGYNHKYAKCNKHFKVETLCHPQIVNGKRVIKYDDDRFNDGRRLYVRNNSKRGCWHWICDNHTHDERDYMERLYCTDKVYVKCDGHWAWFYDKTHPCVCDTWPERPTCTIEWVDNTGGRRWYFYGGIPSAFVSTYYHRPERARERKLDDMRREYNGYGDIEDDDFENRQARSSAQWMYW